jgi:hypothetical protein
MRVAFIGLASARDNAHMFDRARLSVGEVFRSGVKVICCYYDSSQQHSGSNETIPAVVYLRACAPEAMDLPSSSSSNKSARKKKNKKTKKKL